MGNFSGFINMSKYKETKDKTQIENFTTEIVVFLLNYLLSNKKQLIYKLLNVFGINDNIKLDKIIIQSQYRAKIGKKDYIPDIAIKYKNKIVIIEVKVDSELNEYKMDRKLINQLDLYSKINNVIDVYLLTKRIINIKNNNKRVFWTRIYSILESSNDYVIKSFLYFLEVNGMAPRALDENIYNVVDTLSCIALLIHESLDFGGYHANSLEYYKNGCIGCYIKNKDNKNIFWLGQTDDHIKYIVLAVQDKKHLKILKDNKYKFGFQDWVFDELEIKKLLEAGNWEKQKEIMKNWLTKAIKKIEVYINKK